MFKYITLVIYFCCLTNVSIGERIALGKIYQDIESKFFCFRRLNATHQFGCQSDFSGSIGVLYPVVKLPNGTVDEDDIQFIVSKGPTPPYTVVINVDTLSTKVMELFRDSGRVSGVIVVKRNNTNLDAFSVDKSCPNENFGLYSSFINRSYSDYEHCSRQKWNDDPSNPVSELFFRDFDFPIILIEGEDDIVNIEKCIANYGVNKQNPKRSWPLCSVELYARMNAAKNSKTCMRRNSHSVQVDNALRYCDPIGSYNLFNPLIPINPANPVANKSLIILASRLDAFSLFFDKTPGADSPLTSIAVILSVAETLGKIRVKIDAKRKEERNLLITLFNGESFDYIGSGRTAYDLKTNSMKAYCLSDYKSLNFTSLSFEHLSSFIELEQLAPHSTGNVYLHTDPISNRDPDVNRSVTDLIEKLRKPKAKIISQSSPSLPLPPASFQSFLREYIKLPGIVLANHDKEFENKFYNSFVDDSSNIQFGKDSNNDARIVTHLASISTQISQALYTLLTDETDATITSDPETIKDLLYCFVINASCPLFLKYNEDLDKELMKQGITTFPIYTSIGRGASSFVLLGILAQILASFTGTFYDVDEKKCKEFRAANNSLSYYYLQGFANGSCVESQSFITHAVSPVFLNEDPDWSLPYSTWTESVWESPTVRIFLQPGPKQEWFTLIGGLLITLLSFLVVRFLRNQSKTLFKLPSDNGVSLMRGNGIDC